jgi:hypothetical protein
MAVPTGRRRRTLLAPRMCCGGLETVPRPLTGMCKTRYLAAVLLALNGLGHVIAGIFTLDPSNGFPIGAPDGLPEAVSTHGNLHGLGFGLSIVTWVSLLVVLALLLERNDERPWARACLAGAVALVVTGACLVTPFGTVLLYVVLTSTWLLTAAVLNLLRRW